MVKIPDPRRKAGRQPRAKGHFAVPPVSPCAGSTEVAVMPALTVAPRQWGPAPCCARAGAAPSPPLGRKGIPGHACTAGSPWVPGDATELLPFPMANIMAGGQRWVAQPPVLPQLSPPSPPATQIPQVTVSPMEKATPTPCTMPPGFARYKLRNQAHLCQAGTSPAARSPEGC